MSQPRSTLINALLEPGRYPEPTASVDLIETHASWVLLAGAFAYKIKKPITLPFLDYGTLERRGICCEAELRLNRRFAPELYLDLIAITGTPENPQLGGAGAAIEFAVKMRRFDESGRLDHVCARGELTAAHVSQLAAAIADFHSRAAVAPANSRFGSPAEVLAPALENFIELYALLPAEQDQTPLGDLERWTRAEFERLTPQFAARQATNCVRECHGDLHLGNLVLIGDRVRLFDCIEFNEDFRWIDVASELAFIYVDLLDHRQPGLAAWLLNEYLSATGDYAAMAVLRFYAVYRAMVRAKVAAIRSGQGAGDGAEARGYLALAKHLAAPQRPRLVVTHGLSGCGKSTAAMRLVLDDPAGSSLRLRSDTERKRLYGLSATARTGAPLEGGIYSAEANALTYSRLHALAALLLAARWSAIVDATFLRRVERADFRALADTANADFFILAPRCPPQQLHERIAARATAGEDASEATLHVLENQLQVIEALDDDERARLLYQSQESALAGRQNQCDDG